MGHAEQDYFVRHLSLRQFQILKAVVDLGGHSAAARELKITQPSISIQLAKMQEILGAPLFETIGRRQHLTEVGRMASRAANAVLGSLQALEDELSDLEGSVKGELRVAVVTTAKYFIPYLLGAFVERHPAVVPRLAVVNRAQLLERIGANQDDLYIMGQVPDGLRVEAVPILDNDLVIVAPPDHALGREKRAIPLKRIVEERFLLREPGSGTRLAFDGLLGEHGLRLEPYMELGNSEAIKQGVMAGLGLSVLSLTNLRLELADHHLIVLNVEGLPMKRRWYAVTLKGKQLTGAARTFLEFLVHEARRTSTTPEKPQSRGMDSRKRKKK